MFGLIVHIFTIQLPNTKEWGFQWQSGISSYLDLPWHIFSPKLSEGLIMEIFDSDLSVENGRHLYKNKVFKSLK